MISLVVAVSAAAYYAATAARVYRNVRASGGTVMGSAQEALTWPVMFWQSVPYVYGPGVKQPEK